LTEPQSAAMAATKASVPVFHTFDFVMMIDPPALLMHAIFA